MKWILKEEDYETKLMKFDGQWFIRQGNYITLSELFHFGRKMCSCWDLHRTYKSLDIWIHRKAHSLSSSENGLFRQNAKRYQKEQTGYYGLRR